MQFNPYCVLNVQLFVLFFSSINIAPWVSLRAWGGRVREGGLKSGWGNGGTDEGKRSREGLRNGVGIRDKRRRSKEGLKIWGRG